MGPFNDSYRIKCRASKSPAGRRILRHGFATCVEDRLSGAESMVHPARCLTWGEHEPVKNPGR